MSVKIKISFTEINRRLEAATLPDVDSVIGIATGGIVPATMVAHQLEKPLALLHINFRSDDNSPRFDEPVLLAKAPTLSDPSHLLLVDDVSVTGQTLALAKRLLCGHDITTLVLKGEGDIVLFPEIRACVHWPWLSGSQSRSGFE